LSILGTTLQFFIWANEQKFVQPTPQCHEQHHPEYLQFDRQSSHHSSYNQPVPQSTLEDTFKTFMQLTSEAISDMKNATMVNTQVIAKLEWQIDYLVAELDIIEDEEF
jgi:hypothetical protein